MPRARTQLGSAALGAVIFGRIAEWAGVPVSLTCAAGSMLIFLVLTRGRALGGVGDDDLSPRRLWDEPTTTRPVEMSEGPVMVTVEYLVDPARVPEFEAIMAESRGARLRQGALSWGMFEDVQQPGRFIEYFACETWADYLRRFDRFTAADERLHSQRYALHVGTEPPRVQRYVAWPPSRHS